LQWEDALIYTANYVIGAVEAGCRNTENENDNHVKNIFHTQKLNPHNAREIFHRFEYCGVQWHERQQERGF
jgi:hypothetical protein